jgi:outer membrane protein OmpA-like peptidoglycan-associated protein
LALPLAALVLLSLGGGEGPANAQGSGFCATEAAQGRYPPGCPPRRTARRPTPRPPTPRPQSPPGPGPTVNARASDLRVGAQVRDADGAALGTIRSSDATGAVIARMGYLEEGRLPLAAIGRNRRGLVVSRARLFAAQTDGDSPQRPRTPASFTINFDFDRDDINPAAAAILDNAVAAWRRLGNAAALIYVTGHTDSLNSDAYSVALSQRMANNARTYLVGRGVPERAIATEALGESRPLVETIDGVREPRNRRVEIRFNPGASAARPPAPPQTRAISITSRCSEPFVIRILYQNGGLKYPADTPDAAGLWWNLAPGATIRPAFTNRQLVRATTNELYYSLSRGTQVAPLAEATMQNYGRGQSYPFRRVTGVTVNSNGDWAFQIC